MTMAAGAAWVSRGAARALRQRQSIAPRALVDLSRPLPHARSLDRRWTTATTTQTASSAVRVVTDARTDQAPEAPTVAADPVNGQIAGSAPPHLGLLEPVTRAGSDVSAQPPLTLAGAAASERRVHRPRSLPANALNKGDPKKMERVTFRALLEDCVATGTVSARLRTFLTEYPIMNQTWSDQEIVLIVGALIRSNRSKRALTFIRNQLSNATISRVNRVAAESARLGNSVIALGVLDIARHFDLEPDVITYTSAIHACARGPRDDIATAFELLDEMIDAGVEPNHRTYGAIVLAYARLSRWDDIEMLVNNIPYTKRLTPCDVFSSAITTCTRNRQFVCATRLFALYMDRGEDLGEKVTVSALSACSRTSDPETLYKLLAFIEQRDIPSLYTYNAIISAYGNAQNVDKALATYERMIASGNVTPDRVTFNALVMATRRSRRSDLVPRVLDEMAAQGIHWDRYTFNNLLELCQLNRDVAQARAYWEMAKEQRLRPDRANYETLLGVYCEAGEYELVLGTWRGNVTCRRRAKTSKTLNFLLRACAKLGDVNAAHEILDEFARRGHEASSISLNHLLATHLTAGDWPGALEHLTRVATEPAYATTFAFTAAIKHAAKTKAYADALEVYDLYERTVQELEQTWCPQLRLTADAIFVYAMRAAMALGDHEKVLTIYSDLPGDIATSLRAELVRVVLESCARVEDWRTAVLIFDDVAAHIDEDTNTEFYGTVVRIVARAGEFERALEINGGDWYRQNRKDQGWF